MARKLALAQDLILTICSGEFFDAERGEVAGDHPFEISLDLTLKRSEGGRCPRSKALISAVELYEGEWGHRYTLSGRDEVKTVRATPTLLRNSSKVIRPILLFLNISKLHSSPFLIKLSPVRDMARDRSLEVGGD